MAYVVGPRFELVIAPHAREELGLRPGWRSLQLVVGDHLEIYFVPPRRTKRGSNARPGDQMAGRE